MPVSQEFLEKRTKESTRLEPTATGGELWIACEGTGLSTGGRAHSSLFFCSADEGVQQRGKKVNAWIFALLTTGRDLESSSTMKIECLDMCTTDNRP